MNPGPQTVGTRLQHSILAMLATLVIVAAGDAIIGSLYTGKIRLWFPVWFDPDRAVDPGSPVVYSQSYIAGIALLLPLLHVVERHALRLRPAPRKLYWLEGTGILAFMVWWKGGRMLEHGKEVELIGSSGFGTEEIDGRQAHAFEHFLRLAASGRIDPALLVAHRFPLARYREAILVARDKEKHRSLKVLLDPTNAPN